MTIPLTIVLITEALDTELRLVSFVWDMSLTCYPETLHCLRDQSTWDSWPALCWGPEPGRSAPRSSPRGWSERPLGGWASEDHPHRSKHQLNNNLKLQTNLVWSEHLTKILWIVRHWQNQVFLLPFHKFNGIFKFCYTFIIRFLKDINAPNFDTVTCPTQSSFFLCLSQIERKQSLSLSVPGWCAHDSLLLLITRELGSGEYRFLSKIISSYCGLLW